MKFRAFFEVKMKKAGGGKTIAIFFAIFCLNFRRFLRKKDIEGGKKDIEGNKGHRMREKGTSKAGKRTSKVRKRTSKAGKRTSKVRKKDVEGC